MTKEMFLREMSRKLHQLPEKEVKQRLSYYEEMLDDMIEDGIAEEEAVAKLGNINEIVEEILCEQPLPTLVKNRVRPKRLDGCCCHCGNFGGSALDSIIVCSCFDCWSRCTGNWGSNFITVRSSTSFCVHWGAYCDSRFLFVHCKW